MPSIPQQPSGDPLKNALRPADHASVNGTTPTETTRAPQGESVPAPTIKPDLVIDESEIGRMADAVESAIATAPELRLFKRDKSLVRVIHYEDSHSGLPRV